MSLPLSLIIIHALLSPKIGKFLKNHHKNLHSAIPVLHIFCHPMHPLTRLILLLVIYGIRGFGGHWCWCWWWWVGIGGVGCGGGFGLGCGEGLRFCCRVISLLCSLFREGCWFPKWADSSKPPKYDKNYLAKPILEYLTHNPNPRPLNPSPNQNPILIHALSLPLPLLLTNLTQILKISVKFRFRVEELVAFEGGVPGK